EPLVEEEGVEPSAAPRHHLREREREGERREERLATRQRLRAAHLAGGVEVEDVEAVVLGEAVTPVGELVEMLAAQLGELRAFLLQEEREEPGRLQIAREPIGDVASRLR